MQPLTRLINWQERLIDAVNARRRVPYRYGTNDCARFAQICIEAVTGTVLLPDVERPQGWLAAAKFMIARGWTTPEDMATELIGHSCDLADVGPGDIVSYEHLGELHLAVRVGDAALAPVDAGLKAIPPGQWRRGWKVG